MTSEAPPRTGEHGEIRSASLVAAFLARAPRGRDVLKGLSQNT